ncbi:hypothetical protein COEREDRAFT_81623 [Coemansia reversa NRRL 1564]|uniref:RING-type domain-containing protein n=1 Tax=Coemansia reversa (strain ATCC 12441 / NRRL 1564) TaxID=763665 RepID=A0A2G5BA80_COERN|nr:hypothetical protein COEREDRAFT_81623 [Coemansia reversa NRRL 1564]|eukprot:PIA15900.1 hypothetical protein COEREDRAFT_81623 [Coemansia reversa NRRL 1564]
MQAVNHLRRYWRRRRDQQKGKHTVQLEDMLSKYTLNESSIKDIRRPHACRRYLVAAPQPQLGSTAVSRRERQPNYRPSSASDIDNIPVSTSAENSVSASTIRCGNRNNHADSSVGCLDEAFTASTGRVPTCVVCLEEYMVKEAVCVLPCGHIFHDTCILQWLLRSKPKFHDCPICKTPCFADEAAKKAKQSHENDRAQREAPASFVSVF